MWWEVAGRRLSWMCGGRGGFSSAPWKQIVDPVSLVPMLHDVVPQMVELLVDLLAPLDFRVAEQVIEVPKIVCPPRAARTVLRAPQTAEQLVEVPTVLSYSSLQQLIVEQTVDIPVPGRAGGRGRGGLQGHSGQDSTAFFGADRVGIPGGGLQGSRPGQGSASSSSSLDHAGQGVFRTFPRKKKSAKQGPHSGSELSAEFNPSTLSAHQMPPEQLVDVPVPQILERPGRRELHEVLRRLEEVEEVTRWREQNALLAEVEVDEDEEEEEKEGSRFLPHFRPRRWCLYVQVGGHLPSWVAVHLCTP